MSTTAENDIKFRALALNKIDQKGKNLTFTVDVDSYDPTTGKNTKTSVAHVRKASPPYPVSLHYVTGDLIQVGDLTTFVAASGLTFTPVNGMKVTFDGETWFIVAVKPIRPGEQFAAYELHMRR